MEMRKVPIQFYQKILDHCLRESDGPYISAQKISITLLYLADLAEAFDMTRLNDMLENAYDIAIEYSSPADENVILEFKPKKKTKKR